MSDNGKLLAVLIAIGVIIAIIEIIRRRRGGGGGGGGDGWGTPWG